MNLEPDSSTADGTPKPGVRIGPMTWVPGLRARPGDPWAHRKGEPRPLALLWSMYLMVSALLTLLGVRSLTMPTTEQFVFGCRGMLLMTLVGVSVLWPMVRLSQQRPDKPGRSLLADLAVLLAPVQAVIWPMPLLTHWSWSITAALMLAVASWAVFAAGWLRIGYQSSAPSMRWMCMSAIAFITLAAPGARIWLPASLSDQLWPAIRILSPITAAWGLTDAPSGLSPVMQPWEWLATMIPGLFGMGLWIIAGRLAPEGEGG